MRTNAAAGLAAVLGAMTIAACGSGSGSGADHPRTAPSSSRAGSTLLSIGGGPVAGAATARYGVKASEAPPGRVSAQAATTASTAPSRAFFARSVRTKDSEDATPTKQRIIHPCSLVSRGEAAAILGGAVSAPREAPLGPTCIYQSPARKVFVTLSVQVRRFAKLPSQEKSLRRFVGVGRPAFCGGTTGATSLFVRISPDEVLDVSGPCLTAGRFAAHALLRLRATTAVPVQTP